VVAPGQPGSWSLGAAPAVRLAGPVIDAVAELIHLVLIVAGVIVGAVAARLAGAVHGCPRPAPPIPGTVSPLRAVVRAAQQLPAPRPVIGRPHEIHPHPPGVAAGDIAPSSPGGTQMAFIVSLSAAVSSFRLGRRFPPSRVAPSAVRHGPHRRNP
jgi:hypothetical protein